LAPSLKNNFWFPPQPLAFSFGFSLFSYKKQKQQSLRKTTKLAQLAQTKNKQTKNKKKENRSCKQVVTLLATWQKSGKTERGNPLLATA